MKIQNLETRNLLTCILDATAWAAVGTSSAYTADYTSCGITTADTMCAFIGSVYGTDNYDNTTPDPVLITPGTDKWTSCLAVFNDYATQATDLDDTTGAATAEAAVQTGINVVVGYVGQVTTCYESLGSLITDLRDSTTFFASTFDGGTYPCSNTTYSGGIDAAVAGQNAAYNMCQTLINAGWVTSCVPV